MSDDTLIRQSDSGAPTADEVAFDYIKAPDFRVVWADGAIGGITAQGLVHVAFYAERPAIPRRHVFKIDPDTGELGGLIAEKTVGRIAHVREMGCDLMLTPDTARRLGAWLLQQADAVAPRVTNQ